MTRSGSPTRLLVPVVLSAASLALCALPAAAARLAIGTASARAGGGATLDLTYSAEGSRVSAFTLDVLAPSALAFASASAGPVAVAADKRVESLPVTGGVRLLLYGLNQSVLGDGVAVRVSFAVSATATPGVLAVTASGALAADPTGAAVSLATTPGSVTVAGGTTGPALLLPVLLSLGGAAGSYYTTELTMTNRSGSEATLTLSYTATLGGGSGTGTDRLPAGRQKIVPDAIEYLRGLGVPIPADESRLGTLRISVSGAPLSQVAVTARTSTLVPEGRAGLAYAAVPDAGLLTGPSWIAGLRSDARDRSNVAFVNGGRSGEGDLRLRVTVRSGTVSAPGSGSFETDPIPPGGFLQLGLDQLLQKASLSLPSPNVFVRVERSSGTAPYTAYGVVNDQLNSDGSFITPLPDGALTGKTGLVLPVVVETSTFASELVATNLGSARRTLQLSFVASAVTAPGNAAVDTLTLEPGEQRIIPGFVSYLRSRGVAGVGPAGPVFAGAVFASVPGGDVSGLVLSARTAAPGSVKGYYGLFYGAVPSGGAAASAAWLYGLQQNGENRTNVAFASTGETDAGPIRLRVELYDGDTGQRVAAGEDLDRTLEARRWDQIGTILAPYGVTNAYARVVRLSGANPFVTYAVVNDGSGPGARSGDGAYLPMAAE